MKYDVVPMTAPSILLSGATSYVGRRLLRSLEAQKIPVRVAAAGDAASLPALKKALTGIHTAFYLESLTKESAKKFAHACAASRVQRIIYLGRLGSCQKVGEILIASGVPVLEFRTSIIVGSGSPSFEMIRSLVERMPVLMAPRWVYTLAQPIAIEDVIAYLMAAIPYRGPSRVFEIGGPEQLSYREIIKEYARQRRLRRWIISLPTWVPQLSRFKDFQAARVVSHPDAARLFPVRPRSCDEAIARALQERGNVSSVS
jgi:uncharacterized protein YbjT (DUF2867 family)